MLRYLLVPGLVILQSPARLGESVCTLCLPRGTTTIPVGEECTVTGYGRPTAAPVLARGHTYWADSTTDGVLREAGLTVRGEDVCRDHVRQETGAETNMTSLLCAGGSGQEKVCYVSVSLPAHSLLLSRWTWTEAAPSPAPSPPATTTWPASCPGGVPVLRALLQGETNIMTLRFIHLLTAFLPEWGITWDGSDKVTE